MGVTVDGSLSYNYIPFTFYGVCLEDQCVNGFCSFGRCQCFFGWRGDSCEEELEPPIISEVIEVLDGLEGQPLSFQLELAQGSLPVEWSIISPLEGMKIDSSAGLFEWSSPFPSSELQSARIQVQNEIASATTVLNISISPAYYVVVSTTTETELEPSPKIFFEDRTLSLATDSPVGALLANLWVLEEAKAFDQRQKLLVKTDSTGRFGRLYQPRQNDRGVFLFGGEHASFYNSTLQGQFTIKGVEISPSSATITRPIQNYGT